MYQSSQLTSLYNQPDYKYQPPSKRIGHSEMIYHYPRQIYPPQKSMLSTKSLLSYTHHLEAERNNLFNQLSEERLCNNRSKTIIDDLITSSKRIRNKDNIGRIYGGEIHNKSKGERSSYSEGRFKEEKETQQKRGSEKGERERSNNSFLRGNEIENNNLEGLEILASVDKKREGREQTNKTKTLPNEELANSTIKNSSYQNNIHSNITNNTKSAIFRKLYIESSNEPYLQKTPIKEQPQTSIKEEFRSPNERSVYTQSPNVTGREEIEILKQQLEEKNRMIINLQCELLKQSENGNKNKKFFNTSIKEIETVATINDYENSETNLSTKKQCSFNPACVSLTISSTKKIEKEQPKKRFSLCEKMCLSINQENEKVFDNSFKSKLSERSCQTFEEKRNLANLGMTQEIYKLVILPFEKIQKESTESQTLVNTQEETETQTEAENKEEREESTKNMETQTSECYYDYIESTYLEWMFDKEFEEMQKLKKDEENLKEKNVTL